MAEARDRAAWNRTFAILAQIYNANRAADAEPMQPLTFFPWDTADPDRAKTAPPPTEEDKAVLREIFPSKKK